VLLVLGSLAHAQDGATGETQEKQPTQSQKQDDKPAFERLELRVSVSGPGAQVSVDRGTTDGIQMGDRVFFYPRNGGTYRGSVIELSDRSAIVKLLNERFVPAVGTRGEVRIPKARLEPKVVEPPVRTEPAQPEEEKPADTPLPVPPVTKPGATPETTPKTDEPADKTWQNEDDAWKPDMPLLAGVQAQKPEERAPRVTGRMYAIGDYIGGTLAGRSDTFVRYGTALTYDNPFGKGGGMDIDAELNYRNTDVPDLGDESRGRLRIDRFSYYRGGNRFTPERWEAGRFLQHGMPEFGIVDGVEWGTRLDNGDRFGASVGLMPEPKPDLDTGDDLQVSAYYDWVADTDEVLTVGAGVQKTWHHGNRDRDLLLTKVRYLPFDGWDFHGTFWVDFYNNDDAAKLSKVELTQTRMSTSRRWDSGNGIDIAYNRTKWPELQRYEFRPVLAVQLQEDHSDRLSAAGWRWVGKDQRLHSEVGLWADEDEVGTDFELGMDVLDLWWDGSRADVTVFGDEARYETVAGVRLSYGVFADSGRWDLMYEVANHRQDDFTSNRDDILQHRGRLSRSLTIFEDWSCSLHADVVSWDDEYFWIVGFYLQRGF